MIIRNRRNRARLLSGAGTVVLATLIASGAHAATTNVTQSGVPNSTATADVVIESPLSNSGAIDASVAGAQGKIEQSGVQTGTTNTVSANTIASRAIGNSNQASIPALSAIGANGAAILNTSVNAPGADLATGVVTSSVSDSALSIDLVDFQSGSATNSGNTISADATLNSASSSISGSLPNNSVLLSETGLSTLGFDDAGATLTGAGTVVISSVQQAAATGQGAGSGATVSDNEVTLELTSTDGGTVASAPVLDDNTISATFKGNAARNTADIQAGGNPAFAGSAVVTNAQVNVADTPSDGEAAARNSGSVIGASVDSLDSVNTLAGSLSVAGNSITSAATGNETLGTTADEAGNRILLGDGMAITGAGIGSGFTNIAYNGGGLGSVVGADLVIHNSQGNVGADDSDQALTSVTENATIGAEVEALDGGSINLSANRIASSAVGNNASNAIATGESTSTFSATVAVANQQTNDNADVAALTANSVIGVMVTTDADTNDATISVAGNTSAASAYGNQVSQNVALDANSVTLGSESVVLTGGTGPQGHVNATGSATVANLQSRYDGSVSATNEGSAISLISIAEDTTASTLAVTGNTQEAVALGSGASNGLSLSSGASTGSGAGIANVQIGNDESFVSANLIGASAGVDIESDGGEISSSVSLDDNLQRAIGYGNSANNAFSLSGNSAIVAAIGTADSASTVNVDQFAPNGMVFDNTGSEVRVAYGVLSNQTVQAGVAASAVDGGLVVSLLDADVEGGSIANRDNTYVAAAYGNDVQNSATITAGQLETDLGGFASVANVTNLQTVGGDAAIRATATGGTVVLTDIEEGVDDSSVETSGNAIQALAYGNRSTGNTVTVEGTNINTAPIVGTHGGATMVPSIDGDPVQLVTDASFSVQNAQSGQGSVTATQRDGLIDAAQVRVAIGDSVSNSNVAADANISTAAATSNSAVNGLTIDANGLATASAVQNFQTTGADVSAFIGLAGVPGTAGGPFDYGIGGTGLSHDSGLNEFTAGTLIVDTSSLDAAEVNYLLANGWTVGSPNQLTRSAVGYSATAADYLDLTIGGTFARSDVVPASMGTPNQGGVTVALGQGISASDVSVAGNTTTGSVTGNSATNSLTVAATEVGNGSGLINSTATFGFGTGAMADHALSNLQVVTSEALTSEVYGTFAIDAAPGAAISGSTLSVSDNSQRSSAVANTAQNNLAVGDDQTTTISAGSALASVQQADAAVTSTSNVELFAPAAVSNSTVNLSGNSNTALGVINDVTNALTVNGTNIASALGASPAMLQSGLNAAGDHVLSNQQFADTSVTSTASTSLYNEDGIAAATSGIVNSTVRIAANSTVAEASANRALNTVSLNGAASQGANAGLANAQTSSADVAANATTSATLGLAGDLLFPALTGSSAAVTGNATTALARGNAATNVLNMSAGSSYNGSVVGTATGGLGVNSVTATAAVLNNQANSGNVTAASVGATYQVALNGAGGINPAVSNGTVGVTDNRVAAEAYGNSTSNQVTLRALNTNAPSAAVGNYQLNSGTIRATATSVTFGTTGIGGAAASTLRATGNQVTATAIGNSAVTTIAAVR